MFFVSIFNINLWRHNEYLPVFLGQEVNIKIPFFLKKGSCILGWGKKPSGINAIGYAEKSCISYLLLEDGFLRSLGLGVLGYVSHSIVFDYISIYYDATTSSDLENLIVSSGDLDERSLQRAADAIKELKVKRLSKYNQSPDRTFKSCINRYGVLVVDQTYGDASVSYGGAGESDFTVMLESAIEDHPHAEILVKIHPDVIAGKKQGYLLDTTKKYGCTVLSEDISPWALFDQVEHVYVVTSQMGFEALMAGKKVHCFGIPFYAGWGLTNDRKSCSRRNMQRSIEQVFYASYIQYSHYINPYLKSRCELEDTLRLLSTQKLHLEGYRGKWSAYGFSNWKKEFVKQYLGEGADVAFLSELSEVSPSSDTDNLLVWSSRAGDDIEKLAADNNQKLWRMEDGFIRSVGLGVDLVRPLSLVIDRCGIYYDSTRPSDLENYLNTYQFEPALIQRAVTLRERLVALKLTKYNVGSCTLLDFPADKIRILVPGQVESDASIAKGSPVIQTNTELLRSVRQANPDAYIIYKPHPDVLSGGRLGELEAQAEQYFDQLITDVAITELFEQVDEVHTMSSLAGFEALLRNVKVYTYGMPFYAGWGLTTDKLTCDRRNRQLTLDQLVAATLILYPIYVEPDTGHVCDVETVIELLYQNRNKVKGPSLKTRLYRFYRKIFEGKR